MPVAWRRDHPGMNCGKTQADQSPRIRQATRPRDHRIQSRTDRLNNTSLMLCLRLSGGERRVGHRARLNQSLTGLRKVCMILHQWKCNTSPPTQPVVAFSLVLKCADVCRQLFALLRLSMIATRNSLGCGPPPFFFPHLHPVPYPTCRLPSPSPTLRTSQYPLSFIRRSYYYSFLCSLFCSQIATRRHSQRVYIKARLGIRVVQYNDPF